MIYGTFTTERPLNESNNESEKKMKMLYNSCLDKDNYKDQLGTKPIESMLEKLGGWSISKIGNTVYNESDSLQLIMERIFKYMYEGIISIQVTENDQNSTVNVIKVVSKLNL